MSIRHQTSAAAYTDAEIAALPTLEPSEDLYTRLGTWDDTVSGVLRPTPSLKLPYRDNLATDWLTPQHTFTTETSVLASTYSVAASEWTNGTRVKVVVGGSVSNDTASGANSLTLRIKLGGTVIASLVQSIPQSSAADNHSWRWEAEWAFIDFLGSRPIGSWNFQISNEGANTNMATLSGPTASGNTHALTGALALDVTAEQTVSDADTSINCLDGYIEITDETAQ